MEHQQRRVILKWQNKVSEVPLWGFFIYMKNLKELDAERLVLLLKEMTAFGEGILELDSETTIEEITTTFLLQRIARLENQIKALLDTTPSTIFN